MFYRFFHHLFTINFITKKVLQKKICFSVRKKKKDKTRKDYYRNVCFEEIFAQK